MACMIHGQSHRAIRYIGEQTAALEVLWIYASRTNHENVAWPGLRGLARDIGRAVGTIQKARRHLVQLQALELIDDYIRPEWRLLKDNDRRKRVGMDRSEYYRPTGKIVVNNETIPIFYVPQKEQSDLETIPHVSNGRTSVAVEHLPDDTERITSTEPDSRSTERNTTEQRIEKKESISEIPSLYEHPIGPEPLPKVNYKEAVLKTWGKAIEGMSGGLIAQLCGTAKKGERHDFRFDIPATALEIFGFGYWYRTIAHGNQEMVRKAEKVKEYFDEFRGAPAYYTSLQHAAATIQFIYGKPKETAEQPPQETTPASLETAKQADELVAALVKAKLVA